MVARPLGDDLDVVDLRQRAFERKEELRVDRELRLLIGLELRSTSELRRGEQRVRLEELHRSVECPEQRQAADVAQEDRTAGGDRIHCPLDDAEQVADIREVLNYRIEDDEVDTPGPNERKIVRERVLEPHPRAGAAEPIAMPPDVLEGGAGEIACHVQLAAWSYAEQDESSSTADLEHPSRAQRKDPRDRVVDPLAHLLGGDRLACVARIPACDVEGRIALRTQLAVDMPVKEGLPMRHVLFAERVARGAFHAVAMARVGDDVGDEARIAVPILLRRNDRLLDCCVLPEDGLDLSGLDAEAPDLDLLINAAHELDRAVGEPPNEVARPIEARSELRAEAVRHEPLGSELRSFPVAAGYPVAADVELAGHADGYWLAVRVEHVDDGVRNRPADRDGGGVLRYLADEVAGREGRSLGGAVPVEQTLRWALPEHLADPMRIERGSADEEVAKRPEGVGHFARNLIEERGRQPERRDAVGAELRSEVVR